MSSIGQTLWERWTQARALRSLFAGAVVLAAAAVSVAQGERKVCTDETTMLTKLYRTNQPAAAASAELAAIAQQTASEATTKRICVPIGLGDPQLLLAVALILLFLWPDISEVTFGVLTIKRKVEQQRAEQTERLASINLMLQAIHLQQTQKQSQEQNVFVNTATSVPEPSRTPALQAATEDAARALIEQIARSDAFALARIPEATELLARRRPQPVRVAIVGSSTAVGRVLRNVHGSDSAISIDGDANASLVAIIAPHAEIRCISVFDRNGKASDGEILRGVDEALSYQAEILLLAFGGLEETGAVMRLALRSGTRQGVVMIAPAGNEGEARANWPGSEPDVLCVGAVTANAEVAEFSNRGAMVNMFSPGVAVPTLSMSNGIPSVFEISGTAAAAAIVAGIAALVASQTSARGTALRDLLTASTRKDLPLPVVDAAALARAALARVDFSATPE